MRRVKYACLQQTLHFGIRDVFPPAETERICRLEYEQYKLDLQRKGVRFSIVDEAVQPDGSLIVRVKKQYNSHNVGDYLN